MTIKKVISADDIKNIFSNGDNKKLYLKELFNRKGVTSRIKSKKAELDAQIIDTWEYNLSKQIIRDLFFETEKYQTGKKCKEYIDEAIKDWKRIGLGDFEWPFSALAFDDYVHKINRKEDLTEKQKDKIVADDAIKFRRIKEINQYRNDYLEYLVVQNDIVIPTFGNTGGVDFYINGKPFDQKVAKSVGKAFQEAHPENFRDLALADPSSVAVSLYENQDENRFGSEPRLFVVYLDSDIDSSSIETQLNNIDFNEPYKIQFEYCHKGGEPTTYNTECFVILLHK